MSDVGGKLLDRANILVKIPDTSPGTTGGIGASYGFFGKNFSFKFMFRILMVIRKSYLARRL
jgi:hypothetical protein